MELFIAMLLSLIAGVFSCACVELILPSADSMSVLMFTSSSCFALAMYRLATKADEVDGISAQAEAIGLEIRQEIERKIAEHDEEHGNQAVTSRRVES